MYCSLFNKSESFTLSDKVALKIFKVVYFVRQYLELQLLTPFVCLTISNIAAVILKHLYNLNIFYLKLQIVIITAINVSITIKTNVAGNMLGYCDVDNNLWSLMHLIGQQTIQAITLGPNHAC